MHTLTYIFVRAILGLFSLLPVGVASALGGKIGQFLGSKTRRHKVALKNLALIYPDKSEAWHVQTAMGMWNHLGRLFAEFPALKNGKLVGRTQYIEGKENLSSEPQALYVSAHFGQWELLALVAKQSITGQLASVYRHINNHKIDTLLKIYRAACSDELIRKKGDNAIALVRALKDGKSLAIMTDQRLTKGVRMKFLGVEAGSNTVACKLAVKTGLPIVIGFVTRGKGAEFNGHIHAPIHPPEQGTDEEKIAAMARQMFDIVEQQIHQYPEQYMWTHDRWKG